MLYTSIFLAYSGYLSFCNNSFCKLLEVILNNDIFKMLIKCKSLNSVFTFQVLVTRLKYLDNAVRMN